MAERFRQSTYYSGVQIIAGACRKDLKAAHISWDIVPPALVHLVVIPSLYEAAPRSLCWMENSIKKGSKFSLVANYLK